jgi:3-phosphoshikimate 1-carboxyvinyltransferase
MLSLMGVNLVRLGNSVTVEPKSKLQNIDYYVPGDPSSAAFLIAIGVLKSKELNIKNVLLNERRIGFLKILRKMNADITIKDVEVQNNENIGTIVVKKSKLKGVMVKAKDVADMVDEFPVFTLLASQAEGNTVVEGAEELRLKESDRIMAMENFILNLGGQINTSSNGYQISGIQKLQGGLIKTEEDHRIAMTGVVANLCINSEIKIDNIHCISDSYPSFFSDLKNIGAEYVS